MNEKTGNDYDTSAPGMDIAIIGMAFRFPGAKNAREYWNNLCSGKESISFFTDEELLADGIEPEVIEKSNYIKASPVIDNVDLFDIDFFGYTPAEAVMIDPQQRMLLECTWEALEQAGYAGIEKSVGVYTGTKMNSYLYHILKNVRLTTNSIIENSEISMGNAIYSVATRISYKLDLAGPSYTLQTACSTGLTAVHLACRSLLFDECRIALAGSSSINVPQKAGYSYQPGSIFSPDGHCRPFDADARGTVFGNGIGIVVLKRLEDAMEDNDTIHAVIKGSAVNNDAANKASFIAPGIEGQSDVILEALACAGIDAETVSFIEAHGTGTIVGDSIEMAALNEAYRTETAKKQFCPIGSVKGNIGHLDAAAGVAGLIKVILCLKHKQIPPTINYSKPNPEIDFSDSPFYVNTSLVEWNPGSYPRRAGISSFGFGGTNAHLILEEFPSFEEFPSSEKAFSSMNSIEKEKPAYVIPLSAKTKFSLDMNTTNLISYLEENPHEDLASISYTLKEGRKSFPYRRVVVAGSREVIINELKDKLQNSILMLNYEKQERSLVYMFPGEESIHGNMARELYQYEPVFRDEVNACCDFLKTETDLDLRQILFPLESGLPDGIIKPDSVQCAMFVIEYSLVKLLESFGLTPGSMIGSGPGEYTAACTAGVFSVKDALTILATRSRLMQIFRGNTQDIPPSLGDSHDNDSILEEFIRLFNRVKLHPPRIPFISNVSGTWIKAEEATDPGYWARHMSLPMLLKQGIRELMKQPDQILLETGPGEVLSSMVKSIIPADSRYMAFSLLPHPGRQIPDFLFFQSAVAGLWQNGKTIQWNQGRKNTGLKRIPLPTYAFDKKRYWVEGEEGKESSFFLNRPARKNPKLAEWFYMPVWKQSPVIKLDGERILSGKTWLIFRDKTGTGEQIGEHIEKRLAGKNNRIILVKQGQEFLKEDENSFCINPLEKSNYDSLIKELAHMDCLPDVIIHLWLSGHKALPVSGFKERLDFADECLNLGFNSLLFLAQGLIMHDNKDRKQLIILTSNSEPVFHGDCLYPERTLVTGPCKVIPQEFPNVLCRHVDIDLPLSGQADYEEITESILAELNCPGGESTAAYRHHNRFVRVVDKLLIDDDETGKKAAPRLKPGGVYLITGGLGGIGLTMAGYLARMEGVRLILTKRSSFPARAEWESWIQTHDDHDAVKEAIMRIREMEKSGTGVMIARADVKSYADMKKLFDEIIGQYGKLDGILHCAGIAGGGIIQLKKAGDARSVIEPKFKGTLILSELASGIKPDFVILFSSTSALVGEIGQIDYCSANAFMDSFAHFRFQQGSREFLSINWHMWRDVGMAVRQNLSEELKRIRAEQLRIAISPEEGTAVFERALALNSRLPQVSVCTIDLAEIIRKANELTQASFVEKILNRKSDAPKKTRPQLEASYEPPVTGTEKNLARLWGEVLGIEGIGIDDEFYELGGHSLLITQLYVQIQNLFQIEFPVQVLFEFTTIRKLGLKVEELSVQKNPVKDKSILEQLKITFPTERKELLMQYLKNKIAAMHGIKAEELSAHVDLDALEFDEQASVELLYSFKTDFKLQVFPHEIKNFRSIGTIARFLLDELERFSNLAALSKGKSMTDYKLQLFYNKERGNTIKITKKNKPMVFLLSSPRAGSTLMRTMLAGHSHLFCPPELSVLFFETMKEWEDSIGFGHKFRWTDQGLHWAIVELYKVETDEGWKILNDFVARNTTIQDLYAAFQELCKPRILVDKTPPYCLDMRTLQYAETIFDKPRYIYLCRHPYAVMESMLKLRLDKLFVRSLFADDNVDPYVVTETVWNISNRNLIDFTSRIDPGRVHRVRFEDFVKNPGEAMQNLCTFLDIPFEETVLNPYDGRKERMLGGLGDPNILLHNRIDPGLADVWKEIKLPCPLDISTKKIAYELGYELPEDNIDHTSIEDLVGDWDRLSDDEIAGIVK